MPASHLIGARGVAPHQRILGPLPEPGVDAPEEPANLHRVTDWAQSASCPAVKVIFIPPGPKLAEVLEARWLSYCDEFRRCSKHCSEEAVHELRVSIRRLLAQLMLVEEVLPGTSLSRLRKSLKRRFKGFGELRDVHVQRQAIGRLLTRHPGLVLLDAELKRREKELVKAAARSLKAGREKKLLNWVVRVLASLAEGSENGPAQRRMFGQIMEATTAAFATVTRRLAEADPAEAATIHRVRLAYKKFRYMVEALSPTWTGYTPKELRRMAYYQRRLGRIQDLEVLCATLARFARRNPASRAAMRPVGRLIDRRRGEAIRAFLKGADEVHYFWPPAVARR